MQPRLIQIREPEMGAKGFLIEDNGLYVLATAAGLLRGMACTHAGSGIMVAHDGVPNGDGFFENRGHPALAAGGIDVVWNCEHCDGAVCPMCFGVGKMFRAATFEDASVGRTDCQLLDRHCQMCKGSGIEPAYWSRNGRLLKRLNQMGMWMLDAGFHHGLTIAVAGGTPSVNIIATVTWMEQGKD